MNSQKFELNAYVQFVMSGEKGQVKGYATYSSGDSDQYWVWYIDATGRAVRAWVNPNELVSQ